MPKLEFQDEGMVVYPERDFRRSTGELYAKMLEMEGRIRTMELDQRYCYHKSITVSMFGLLSGTLALSYILIREYEVWYLAASLFVVVAIVAVAMWNRRWHQSNLAYLEKNGWQRHEQLLKGFLAGTRFSEKRP